MPDHSLGLLPTLGCGVRRNTSMRWRRGGGEGSQTERRLSEQKMHRPVGWAEVLIPKQVVGSFSGGSEGVVNPSSLSLKPFGRCSCSSVNRGTIELITRQYFADLKEGNADSHIYVISGISSRLFGIASPVVLYIP